MKFSEYFTAGQFAKLCGVSRQTLLFYDKSGIFSPEHIDDNGYRYYSYKQYDAFQVVLALKRIGTPLRHIKEFLDVRDSDSLARLLSSTREDVDRAVGDLLSVRLLIDEQLRQIDRTRSIWWEEPALRRQEEEYFILTEQIDEVYAPGHVAALSSLIGYCKERGYSHGFSIGTLMDKKWLLQGEFHRIGRLCVKVFEQTFDPREWHKPEGLYAEIYHKGDYETIDGTYRALLDFLEREHLETTGPFYEYDFINGLAAKSPEDYLIRICAKIAGD